MVSCSSKQDLIFLNGRQCTVPFPATIIPFTGESFLAKAHWKTVSQLLHMLNKADYKYVHFTFGADIRFSPEMAQDLIMSFAILSNWNKLMI